MVGYIVDDPCCDHCGEIESIDPICSWNENPSVTRGMLWWQNWIQSEVWCCFNIQKNHIIFGSLSASPTVNFIALYAKGSTVTQRFQDKEMNLDNLVYCLSKKFQIQSWIQKNEKVPRRFAILAVYFSWELPMGVINLWLKFVTSTKISDKSHNDYLQSFRNHIGVSKQLSATTV